MREVLDMRIWTASVTILAFFLGGVNWHLATKVAKLDQQIGGLREELRRPPLVAASTQFLGGATPVMADSSEAPDEAVVVRTADDVARAVGQIDPRASADALAQTLATMDTWVVTAREEAAVQQHKLGLTDRLRQKVKAEVHAAQQLALLEPTSLKAAERFAEAGQLLSLYPMSQDTTILAEARALASSQAELAARIESLRRQRYNRWATEQIGKAIDGYNKYSSYTKPREENKNLVDSLVEHLGLVDPSAIEPAVLDLYNYVFELTKSSIAESDKRLVTWRLTDPAIRRKTVGDF
jgi:hypothetical protein